jgi:L-threonylcarbamoyladenylate synthase
MNQEIVDAKKALHEGKVLAHATETCYGLAVDIFQRLAVQRLYSIKKMPLDKPVSILVRDFNEAQQYGEFSEKARELAVKYWPGPLTIIVPRKKSLPAWINYGHETVGFRCSSHKKTKEIIEAFGGPLTTTSANIHGMDQAYSVQDMSLQDLKPDFVLDSGKIPENKPTTIVKVEGDVLTIIRQGKLQIV